MNCYYFESQFRRCYDPEDRNFDEDQQDDLNHMDSEDQLDYLIYTEEDNEFTS